MRRPTPTATGTGWPTRAAARCSSTTPPARTSSSRRRSRTSTPITPPCRGFPPTGCAPTSGTTSPRSPQNVHVLAKLDESTYEEEDGTPAADDHPIAWCSNFDRGRSFYTALGHNGTAWQEPATASTSRARSSGPSGAGARRLRRAARRHPDRRVLRQGHARRQHREPDGDRDRPGRQRLLRRARRQGQVLQRDDPLGPHRRHDPGAPRQRERPARHRAGPELRHQQVAVPLLQRARRPRSSTSRASRRRRRQHRHGLREGPAEDPAPADRLLPLVRLHDLRPGRPAPSPPATTTSTPPSQGYAPLDDDVLRNNPGDNPDADRAYDSRRTSGNTNDLRGKILRIKPRRTARTDPGGQPVPAVRVRSGEDQARDLHDGPPQPVPDPGRPGDGLGLQRRGRPRRQRENANRGPRGYDELNQIRQAGNMGWPYCIADNKAYRDWTSPPARRARRSTAPAARTTPPTTTPAWPRRRRPTGALLWWPYSPYPAGFPWATAPTAIPTGAGGPRSPGRSTTSTRRCIGHEASGLLRRQGLLRRLVA